VTARAPGGWIAALLAVLLLAATLRTLFPTADPPWRTTVGVVWHDEGAWTHNARNRALWGTWETDDWNPLYIAPVFTGLEYLAFDRFGVGLWQARLVPQIAGILAVLCLGLGVSRLAGRAAGLTAAAFLATNYVGVMYDRAAIMEGPMSAFLVMAWYACVRAQQTPSWGFVAGVLAILAYFTKAAAVFFVGALGLVALIALLPGRIPLAGEPTDASGAARPLQPSTRAALWTLAGLTLAGTAALALFVVPSWTEYRFYNWQMSVTRKPSYDVASLVNRLTWFPVLHDVLTRMWLVVVLALAAWLPRVLRFRRRPPGEQVLVLWIGVGILELLLHDVGNERRFVFLIPACSALAALLLAGDRALVPRWLGSISRRDLIVLLPLSAYTAYIVSASAVRLAFLYEVRPAVRLGALVAVLLVGATWLARRWLSSWGAQPWRNGAATVVTVLVAGGGVAQYTQWAAGRTYHHVEASRALGRLLPPGTPVHGKLANGLALDNRIRPLFVGREFGNYADRLTRNDVPFLLTYVAPRLGYEGPVILDVLRAYPQHRVIWTFDVAESPSGRDRAALIDKGPPALPTPPLTGTPPGSALPPARTPPG
jgi:Dolichyl-phosphate-mannose-protein mannosyltransferase